MTTATTLPMPGSATLRAGEFRVGSPLFYLLITIAGLIWSAPLIVLVFTAVKSPADFGVNGTFAWPRSFELSNFTEAWRLGIKIYFVNSLVLTVLKVPTGVFICSLAAFAITKMKMNGAKTVFTISLMGMIVPMQMTLVPLTILYQKIGAIDSLPGLFFLYLGFGLPIGILVMRGFFRSIPNEMLEAAFIDGCSWWGVYWRIVMPLAKPALVSLLILDSIATWNEFILAQIFLRSDEVRTLPLGVVMFSGEFGTQYNLLAAGQMMTIIPVLALYLFFQRYFVHGLAGAVK